MREFLTSTTFLKSIKGGSLSEYAIVTMLIAGAGLVAVSTLGDSVDKVFFDNSSAIEQAGNTTPDIQPSGAPEPGQNFAITLGSYSGFPVANPGNSFSFDFSSLVALTDPGSVSVSNLSWAIGGGNPVPQGLILDSNTGVLSGVIDLSAANTSSTFEVIASFETESETQVYTLNVGGVIINVIQVSLGSHHSCAISVNNTLYCWGRGEFGRLGLGDELDRMTPQAVSIPGGVTAVSAGPEHTCSVSVSGNLYCWGQGVLGQLGNGESGFGYYETSPILVSGVGSSVTDVGTGVNNTCAIASGEVYCWGWNNTGNVGNGVPGVYNTPQLVNTLSNNNVLITMTGTHVCALTADSNAYCWGTNNHGQAGVGSTNNQQFPSLVSSLEGEVAYISAGHSHTCAVTTSNALYCWGFNSYGQVGDGTFSTNKPLPSNVASLGNNVRFVSAGSLRTCAITFTNELYCWGYDSSRFLEYAGGGDRSLPALFSGVDTSGNNILDVGGIHACVERSDNNLYCWANGMNGRLGNNDTSDQAFPVPVLWD